MPLYEPPASGTGIATDTIWDAQGDLVYATAADTGARLAKGTAYQGLRMNSGATAPEWFSGSWQVISDQTVSGSSVANVEFASIPGTFKQLCLVVHGRGTQSAVAISLRMRFNNDTGSNYDSQRLEAYGTTQASVENLATTSMFIGALTAATGPANVAGSMFVYIPNYASTTNHKNFHTIGGYRSGTASASLVLNNFTGDWRSTSAVSEIDVFCETGNIDVGSRLTLYGIG